jgi:hypothetical protein
VAGKIIADIIEAPFDSIKMNVANVTVLTANNSGLTYLPTGNVNINIGSTASLTLGNVTVSNLITANGGIAFPATQVSSANANTLDDYEEGTWTPAVTFDGGSTGVTYNDRKGSYTKIGRVVTLIGFINLTNKGSSSGTMQIGGLPFTVTRTLETTSFGGGGVFTFFSGMATNISGLGIWCEGDNTYFSLRSFPTAGVSTTLVTNSTINNDFDSRFSLTYMTS